jgi:hypothetical protein
MLSRPKAEETTAGPGCATSTAGTSRLGATWTGACRPRGRSRPTGLTRATIQQVWKQHLLDIAERALREWDRRPGLAAGAGSHPPRGRRPDPRLPDQGGAAPGRRGEPHGRARPRPPPRPILLRRGPVGACPRARDADLSWSCLCSSPWVGRSSSSRSSTPYGRLGGRLRLPPTLPEKGRRDGTVDRSVRAADRDQRLHAGPRLRPGAGRGLRRKRRRKPTLRVG